MAIVTTIMTPPTIVSKLGCSLITSHTQSGPKTVSRRKKRFTSAAVIYIFYDALDAGDFLGNFLGLITALGLAVGANIIRSAKKISLVPSAMMGKLLVALIALLFVDQINLEGNDLIIVPLMCVMCVAIPFVLVTLAPRYISAAEVNLFFLLETIFGPLWVWLVIKEQPSFETIFGGCVIVITIAIHSILALKKIK